MSSLFLGGVGISAKCSCGIWFSENAGSIDPSILTSLKGIHFIPRDNDVKKNVGFTFTEAYINPEQPKSGSFFENKPNNLYGFLKIC